MIEPTNVVAYFVEHEWLKTNEGHKNKQSVSLSLG